MYLTRRYYKHFNDCVFSVEKETNRNIHGEKFTSISTLMCFKYLHTWQSIETSFLVRISFLISRNQCLYSVVLNHSLVFNVDPFFLKKVENHNQTYLNTEKYFPSCYAFRCFFLVGL